MPETENQMDEKKDLDDKMDPKCSKCGNSFSRPPTCKCPKGGGSDDNEDDHEEDDEDDEENNKVNPVNPIMALTPRNKKIGGIKSPTLMPRVRALSVQEILELVSVETNGDGTLFFKMRPGLTDEKKEVARHLLHELKHGLSPFKNSRVSHENTDIVDKENNENFHQAEATEGHKEEEKPATHSLSNPFSLELTLKRY
jgi:hypothetical protein